MHCKRTEHSGGIHYILKAQVAFIIYLLIQNLFRTNAGWPELSTFLGSFPEIPTGFTGTPGSKLFKQVFSEHYCELPVLEEVALAEMHSPPCS